MVSTTAGGSTLTELLLSNRERRGDRLAVREKRRGIWRTISWREYADEVAAVAAGLSARGLKPGARLALIGDNRPRLVSTMAAAHALGSVVAPLYQDATVEELALWIEKLAPSHVFAENQEQVDKVLELLPRCPSIQCIVFDDDKGMRHYRQPGLLRYADLLAEGRAAGSPDILEDAAKQVAPGDAAFVFFTSRALGNGKGILHTHAGLIDRAQAVASIEGMSDREVVVAFLPPGWVCQCLFSYVQPLVVGSCVSFPESNETLLSDLREIAPSYFLATPRMLAAIESQISMRIEQTGGVGLWLYRRGMVVAHRIQGRQMAGAEPSVGDRMIAAIFGALLYGAMRDALGMGRIRSAYTAGDAIDPALLMFYRAFGINLKQLYGSTETAYCDTLQRDGEVQMDTVGRPVDGVDLKIGPAHEILVRSNGMFTGYLGDPNGRAALLDAEGFFKTGDIGELGENGELRIIDRRDDVGALRDGTPFAPRQLENRLRFSPFIQEAIVLGEGRDRVCALVDIDTAAVSQWADERGITYSGHADLAQHEEVYALIGDCLAEVNDDLVAERDTPGGHQIERFLLLPEDLSPGQGLLTRTGRPQRGAIMKRYGPLVDALYGGDAEVVFATVGADAHAEPAKLRIVDVRALASIKEKRAA